MEPAAAGYRPILFDLDGTVADTYPGIVAAAAATLSAVGLPPVAAAQIYPLTGRGVAALVQGLLASSGAGDRPELFERALALYTETYERTCAEGATAYPGMVELIGRLRAPLALLTNKPRRFTERIASHLGLAQAFTVLVAGDDAGDIAKLKPNPWPIHQALKRLDVPAARPIVVGDTASDVGAARAAGVPCCLVRWGHGPDAAGRATFSVGDSRELEALLTQG